MPIPQVVADDRHIRRSALIRRKHATSVRLDSEKRKQIRGHLGPFDSFGLGLRSTDQGVTLGLVCSNSLKRFTSIFEVLVSARRQRHIRPAPGWIHARKRHNSIGILIREGPQQDRVDNTEYRGVRPDAQRQRHDGYGSESRAASECANRVPKVLGKRIDRTETRAIVAVLFDQAHIAESAEGSKARLGGQRDRAKGNLDEEIQAHLDLEIQQKSKTPGNRPSRPVPRRPLPPERVACSGGTRARRHRARTIQEYRSDRVPHRVIIRSASRERLPPSDLSPRVGRSRRRKRGRGRRRFSRNARSSEAVVHRRP